MDIKYIALLVLIFFSPAILYCLILGTGELMGRTKFNLNKKRLGIETGDWIGLGQGYLGVLLISTLAWNRVIVL